MTNIIYLPVVRYGSRDALPARDHPLASAVLHPLDGLNKRVEFSPASETGRWGEPVGPKLYTWVEVDIDGLTAASGAFSGME